MTRRYGVLFPATALVPWLACLAPFQTPITELKSSYTLGQQSCLEVTPGGDLAFVGEGAAITILDLRNAPVGGSMPVIEKVRLPDCQPLALAYLHQSLAPSSEYHHLYIAGGALGLWRLTLCAELFDPTPTACGESSYQALEIPGVTGGQLEGGYFQRKRCVDVAIIETGASPVLFALYAASNDPSQSAIGPTELHAYTLTGSNVVPLARLTFDALPTTPPIPRSSVGSALAVDPGDPDSVYVAMGKGGIWRVDLSVGPPALLSAAQLSIDYCSSSVPSVCAPPPCVENVRDLAVIRAELSSGTKAFLYAALNYGRILVYDLTAPTPTYTFTCVGCGYPDRIAVARNGQTNEVLVAVAVGDARSIVAESAGPYTTNGLWSNLCLLNHLEDPDDLTGISECAKVKFFKGSLSSPGALSEYSASVDYRLYWGSLILDNVEPDEFRCYTCSTQQASEVREVTLSGTTLTAGLLHKYVGKNYGAGKGVVSLQNPGIVRFGSEAAGLVEFEDAQVYIDTNPPYEISFVPSTKSPCPGGSSTSTCAPSDDCNPRFDPAPWNGDIMGEAHWIQPDQPELEWFLAGSGKNTVYRQALTTGPTGDCTCSPVSDCTAPWDPCTGPSNSSTAVWNKPPALSRGGHRLVRLTVPASGPPANGIALDMRWWQVEIPRLPITIEHSGDSVVYAPSTLDPRLLNGYPRAVYCSRSASDYGVKTYRPTDLLAAANSSCPLLPAVPDTLGFGEHIASPQILHTFTHPELELDENGTTQCFSNTLCGGAGNPFRTIFNNQSSAFEILDPSGSPVTILALAAGFPVTAPDAPGHAQLASCLWTAYYGLPMLVLLDVTETGVSFAQPELLRVGLGGGQGHAWAVETKTYGTGPDARTYAFVGDVLGSILVFDVSYDQLFPAATAPYINPNDPEGNPILERVGGLLFPVDPYDGHRANCVDLELDGDILYCALGNQGVGIVDVSVATDPALLAVIDTPGIVMGLALRTVGTSPSVRQLVVGDSLCGIRVYE